MGDLKKAAKTWLEYQDSDRFDEDKARELTQARIEIREALRQGYRLIDLTKLERAFSDYETKCIVKCFNEENCLRCKKAMFSEIRKIIDESTK